ncbi:MAG: tubulin-like doman-containing protein [bacterium]
MAMTTNPTTEVQNSALEFIMPEYPPTVLIGLGGAGTEAIARVQRRLRNFAQLHPELNFERIVTLGIDLEPLERHTAIAQEELAGGESFLSVGGFVPIDFVQNHSDDSDLQSWWDKRIERVAQRIVTFEAAKTLRQLGRLGLYAKREEIRVALQNAFNAAAGATNVKGELQSIPPQVYIITGTCGGTGSGMFLDMSLLAFQEAVAVFGQVEITGMFVLPDFYCAVDPGNKVNFEKNAFAFFDELEYFSQFPGEFAKYCMEPSRYQQTGKASTFPATKWAPFLHGMLLDNNIGPTDKLVDGAEYSNYLARVVYNRYIATKWERSNRGSENDIQAESNTGISMRKRKRKQMYSTIGTQTAAYPTEAVTQYLSDKYVSELLGEWLTPPLENDPDDVKVIRAYATELDAPFAAAEAYIRSAQERLPAPPQITKEIADDQLQKIVNDYWVTIKTSVEEHRSRLVVELRKQLDGQSQYVNAKLAGYLDDAALGIEKTDKILDTATELLREKRISRRRAQEEATSTYARAQEQLTGVTGKISQWPKKRSQWRSEASSTLSLIQTYFRNRIMSAGYEELENGVKVIVGNNANETNNVLGTHDGYRNLLTGKLRQAKADLEKYGLHDSDIAALHDDKVTKYFPCYESRRAMDEDKTLQGLLESVELTNRSKRQEYLRDLFKTWREDSGARLHLRDIERTDALVEEFFTRIKAQAEEKLAGSHLPSITDAIIEAGFEPQVVACQLADETHLMARESRDSVEFPNLSKGALIVEKNLTTSAFAADELNIHRLSGTVVGVPDEMTSLRLASHIPITKLHSFDVWARSFAQSDFAYDCPHLNRSWNVDGGLAATQQAPWWRGKYITNSQTMQNFIIGRFVDWLLFSKESKLEEQKREAALASLFMKKSGFGRRCEFNPGSWIQVKYETSEDVHQIGYYAAPLISYGGEQFEVSASAIFMTADMIRALQMYEALGEISQSTHTFIDRLIKSLETDIYLMAEIYYERIEDMRSECQKNSSPEDKLLDDALRQMSDLFEDWALQYKMVPQRLF